MRRLAQIAWTLDYLDDIASDMSAFHRVDDVRLMPGPRFFALAQRLPAYQGAMAARLRTEQQEPASSRPARQAQAQARQRPGVREVPGTRTALQLDPAFKGIFSFGNAKSG